MSALGLGCVTCGAMVLVASGPLRGQQQFDLVASQLGLRSSAILGDDRLQVIGPDGTSTQYQRNRRFDSADGAWLGFTSDATRNVLRWPASQRGPMQIGEVVGQEVIFRASQMVVEPRGREIVQRPVLPPERWPPDRWQAELQEGGYRVSDYLSRLTAAAQPVEPQRLHLLAYDRAGAAWGLQSSGLGISMTQRLSAATAWWISPAGGEWVRLQLLDRGQLLNLTAAPGGAVRLLPLASDAGQLWRVHTGAGLDGGVALGSALFPGECLTHVGHGQLVVQPWQRAPMQVWVPVVPPRLDPTFQPAWRTVRHEIVPNPPLPPAEIQLWNSHRHALRVLLDTGQAAEGKDGLRLEPGEVQTLVVERPAGGTLVETYEFQTAFGGWEQRQVTTEVPGSRVMVLSVYEEHLQSIAIDRTGKSPNPIEDVNYVPRSVGALTIVVGPDMPERSRLDVYTRAKAADNPGAVQRLDPRQFDETQAADPLESLLEDFQQAPRRKF